MQNTSNYNLNIVEGTDIVNIPVQLNPNFQTIDSEMFKNKQGSTGTATEVVTGTVHAIVRTNTDADVFRFTATGNWASGDTMTVDGGSVTVHLTDGTAPGAGAYVIGAEVVAVINGTLVTLISSSAAVDPGVTSFNSRTGAVTPTASDYDASMIDYDNTLSGLTATDTQAAIDELASTSGSATEQLWANPNPGVAYAANIETFDIGSHDWIAINYVYANNRNSVYTAIINKNCAGVMARFVTTTGAQHTGLAVQRNATVSLVGTLMSISFADCTTLTIGATTTSTTNIELVPYEVIGL